MKRLPQPIRIGDTFTRLYKFYNPKPTAEWADPQVPEPDLTSPLDLTGITISFNLDIDDVVTAFSGGAISSPAAGQVLVTLTDENTATLNKGRAVVSYLEFSYPDGSLFSRSHIKERILDKGEVTV